MAIIAMAKQAEQILEDLTTRIGTQATVEYADLSSCVGGGAFPELSLPSRCIAVTPKAISAAHLEKKMRMNKPAIIGRIEQNSFIIDTRTIQKGQTTIIADALETILNRE